MTDSNRPRHSLDENFDDDRPLNLEPQHGAHEDPVDAEFEDAEYSDYDADGYDGSYDDGYGEHEDYAAGYAGYHDGDYAEYDDEYAEYEDEYGDGEYEDYDDYDDESAAAAQRHHEAGRRRIGGAAVAGAAGAGAAGAAAGEPGGQVGAEARSGQGLPLRGLAMVLIAVAIALIAWGAVSFVNGGDSEDGNVQAGQEGEDTSNLSPAEQARLAKEKENAERQAARDKAADDAKAEAEKKAEAERRDNENAENQGALSDKDREATHVTVLNNSPIEGLAGRTADGLRGEKWDAKSIGNLPDSAYVFRESVVLYPAGDAKAKAAAEQIAKEHGLEARERNREIDDSLRDVQLLDGPAPGAVIVVTVNDMSR
ncbi:LytR C-terminal domain-containing protein [Corynebacterium sp. HMSC27B11]|uniref:LytR C-terminal domain-containing protein n=1 Tax=Corynebacterium sp. HMSC27B11 TaxID=1581065 RepID=UPI001FEEA7C5|nr:LytR C-terminal domain-containing protein [Corynebacterium sp. HMSC27B11]